MTVFDYDAPTEAEPDMPEWPAAVNPEPTPEPEHTYSDDPDEPAAS